MEFSWGFIALFFVIFFGCGRMCGWGRRWHRGHRHDDSEGSEGERRLSNLESRVKGLGRVREAIYDRERDGDREPAHMRSTRSSELEELQKRFIDGRLTLDDYERELDRLEKIE